MFFLKNLQFNGKVTYFGNSFFMAYHLPFSKIEANSYFGEDVLIKVEHIESIEFGDKSLICEQHLSYPYNHVQTIKFGDGTCFFEEIKAENYYYTGS